MPNTLFFDLDHTLWDFEANAEETLRELYEMYRISHYSPDGVDVFLATYKRINAELWDLYRKKNIKKEVLRTKRFTDTFLELGLPENEIPKDIWETYLDICPTKTKLIPGTIEVLEYLNKDYNLHLITNGFAETQRKKLKHSELDKYFQSLTISEEVGVQKPHPKIFTTALKNAKSAAESSVYVGDSLEADVNGGLNSGWKVFWYNPKQNITKAEIMNHHNLVNMQDLLELKNHY